MSLSAGTVTVNPSTGARTGIGLALALYDAEDDGFDPDDASVGGGWTQADPAYWKAAVIAGRQKRATQCQAKAAAFVAVLSGLDVRIPAGSIDTGVPASDVVLSGAIE